MPDSNGGVDAFQTVVIATLQRLEKGQDELKSEAVALASLQESRWNSLQKTADESLAQGKLTNGRVSRNDERLLSLEAWQREVLQREHDREVERQQRERVIKRVTGGAYSLVRALDHPWVTTIVLGLLVFAGYATSEWVPVPW